MLNASLEVGSSLLVYTIKKIRKKSICATIVFISVYVLYLYKKEKQMREEFERQQQIDKIYRKIV
jgi:ribosomal protein S6